MLDKPDPAAYRRKTMRLTYSGLLGLVCFCGCASQLPHYNYQQAPDPRQQPFVVGPSDQLHITVWRNPNLTTEATIRPDGTITLPLIGDVQAAGRTAQRLRAEIRQRLDAYVKDAIVTVAVTRVNSYRFTVAGRVAQTGFFAAQRYVTVSEAIAMAGGPTQFASPSRIVIVRREQAGRVARIPIDYDAIASGKRPEQDIVVLSGDIVYVP